MVRPSLSVIAGLGLALLAWLVPAGTALMGGERCLAEERFDGAEMRRQIFFAVTEGLYRDGLSREAAAKLVEVDADGWPRSFVSGCPVCMPAFNALRCYAERPPFVGLKVGGDHFGDGLDPALEARLLGDVDDERLEVLHGLVQAWVGRRMDALRLTDAERAVWSRQLEQMRKGGMSSLQAWRTRDEGAPAAYASMSTCAVCDGAHGACSAVR